MGYKDLNNETNELYDERLELVTQRLAEIEKANELYEPFAEYFRKVASYLLLQKHITKNYMTSLRLQITRRHMQILHTQSRCWVRSMESFFHLYFTILLQIADMYLKAQTNICVYTASWL